MKQLLLVTAFALALAGTSALADDGDADDGLDVTITLMPEDADLPDAVTAAIELPQDEEGPIPNEEGVEHSADGLETANLAREDGRAFGEATAASADENRENLGRGSLPDLEDLVPDNVPETPDLPEIPSPPVP
jgi:hypothetical protein